MTLDADDLAIVAALQRGDGAAFGALVRRHQAGFLRLARAWVKDSASAAEVVQQAWLTALESLATFEGRSRRMTAELSTRTSRAAPPARPISRKCAPP